MAPLLPGLAEKLAAGFSASRQGCFLWATDSIVREFSEGAEQVDTNTSNAIYHFYEQQTVTFLRALNDLPPEELPDGTFMIMKCIVYQCFRLLTVLQLSKTTSVSLRTPFSTTHTKP